MANKSTKRTRHLHGFKVKTGRNVDSSALRRKSGRKPYAAPTLDRHPVSGR